MQNCPKNLSQLAYQNFELHYNEYENLGLFGCYPLGFSSNGLTILLIELTRERERERNWIFGLQVILELLMMK